jgi:hypothetical protein
MKTTERRNRRSSKEHQALNFVLAALGKREGIESLTVSTRDGFLVAGVGHVDLEWIGAIGASAQRRTLAWEDEMLFVQPLEINRMPMFLTSAGRPAQNITAVQSGFNRILG